MGRGSSKISKKATGGKRERIKVESAVRRLLESGTVSEDAFTDMKIRMYDPNGKRIYANTRSNMGYEKGKQLVNERKSYYDAKTNTYHVYLPGAYDTEASYVPYKTKKNGEIIRDKKGNPVYYGD